MKISVIVPVYNAEKYLDRCICSVIEQSYEDWEMILINDGSTDESMKIIDKYKNFDSRIVSLNQKNAGPGVARNNGIKAASGDYIVFLDSDDYIDSDYFSLLNKRSNDCDVVFIDVLQVDSNDHVLRKEYMSKYKKWSVDRITRSQLTGKIPWGGVRKAVKAELIKTNEILYTSHSIGEEALFSFRVLQYAKSVTFLDDKPVYYYVNHAGSQSKQMSDDPWGGVVDTIREYLLTNNIYPMYADTLNAFNVVATVISIDRISNMYSGTAMKIKAKDRIEKFTSVFDATYGIDYTNIMTKSRLFAKQLSKGRYWMIYVASKVRYEIKNFIGMFN